MSRVIRRTLMYVLALPFLLWAGEPGKPTHKVLGEVAKSVVKVIAGDSSTLHKVGTGFIWPDKNHVVTALHVVDGPREQITILYVEDDKVVNSSPATVERVLKEADLVLLRLERPNSRDALRIDTSPLAEDALPSALGFLHGKGISESPLSPRYGPHTLEKLLPDDIEPLWKADTYPNKKIEILNFSGHLLKGQSGSPVVDAQGRVVGVGDGGLEGGAASVSWAIPAVQLEKLLKSNDARLPNNPVVKDLFTADILDSSKSPVLVESNEVELALLRTRSLERLANTADDQLPLLIMANSFQDFAPQSFRYDIYTDLPSGATLAVPAGLPLSANGGSLSVETGDQRIQMPVEIDRIHSIDELHEKFDVFSRKVLDAEDIIWVPDPNWQRIGMIGDDIMLVRAALNGMIQRQGQLVQVKCMYMVGAARESIGTLLMAAALDNDCTEANVAMEQRCRAGLIHPACREIIRPRRLFAQLAIGIQLSTFSR